MAALFGALGVMGGLPIGTGVGVVAALLGPHAVGIVPYWISAPVLAAGGYAVWSYIIREIDSSTPSASHGDLRTIGYFGATGLVGGYAVACTLVMASSALWGSADSDMRRLAYCAPLVPLAMPWIYDTFMPRPHS